MTKGRKVTVPKQYPTPGAKITPDQVRTIRSDWGYGYSQAELARRYWVHPSTISRIVHHKTWKGVHDE